MTLYYQIHETTTVDRTFYEVQKVHNLFGLMFTLPMEDVWLSFNSLYAFRCFAKKFDTLENAQQAAQKHANSELLEARIRKTIKRKVVQTLVINEIK